MNLYRGTDQPHKSGTCFVRDLCFALDADDCAQYGPKVQTFTVDLDGLNIATEAEAMAIFEMEALTYQGSHVYSILDSGDGVDALKAEGFHGVEYEDTGIEQAHTTIRLFGVNVEAF